MYEYIEKIITFVKNDDYKNASKVLKQLKHFTDYYTIYYLLIDDLKSEQIKKLFNY